MMSGWHSLLAGVVVVVVVVVIVVVVVRSLLRTSEKGGEGQKRLLYKAKLCYRDQNRAF